MCLELMLSSVNLTFVAFGRTVGDAAATGVMFALFAMVVGAAEIGVGLALVLVFFREGHANVDVRRPRHPEGVTMPLWLTAVLVPGLPALSFVVLAALRRRLGEKAGYLAVGALAVVAGRGRRAARQGDRASSAPRRRSSFTRRSRGRSSAAPPLDFGVLVDGLSASMIVMVGIVATMVVTYAIGYMHGDERFAWFFAVISLFTASMFGLVTASSLLQIMVFWEIMGLCSYLLIGFWYERPEARSASIKAFLTTRVGDIGFLTGVMLLYIALPHARPPRALPRRRGGARPGVPDAGVPAALLRRGGEVGAVPAVLLAASRHGRPHARLRPAALRDDGRRGRVPRRADVSAVRGGALRAAAWSACAGLFSATFGALLALTETDIKRTLAYSTMSQLGYMMGALGAGGLVAGVFHLITHGFFKSLLFLAAGSVIHGCGTQDVREMGGLREEDAEDGGHVPRRHAARSPACRRCRASSARTPSSARCGPARPRGSRAVAVLLFIGGVAHGGADGVLHVPPVLHASSSARRSRTRTSRRPS